MLAVMLTGLQVISHQSIELYSEGRYEDLESSDYMIPLATTNCSSFVPNIESSFNMSICGTRDHGSWSQYLSEDPFSIPTYSFPSYEVP